MLQAALTPPRCRRVIVGSWRGTRRRIARSSQRLGSCDIQCFSVVESNHLYIYLTHLEPRAHCTTDIVLKLIEPVCADSYRSASFYALVHNLEVNFFPKFAMLCLINVINHQEVCFSRSIGTMQHQRSPHKLRE